LILVVTSVSYASVSGRNYASDYALTNLHKTKKPAVKLAFNI